MKYATFIILLAIVSCTSQPKEEKQSSNDYQANLLDIQERREKEQLEVYGNSRDGYIVRATGIDGLTYFKYTDDPKDTTAMIHEALISFDSRP